MTQSELSMDGYAQSSGLSAAITKVNQRRLEKRSGTGNEEPLAPHLDDLVRIHHLVRNRRVLRVLELGGGWSTVAIAHALSQNQAEYAYFVENELRCEQPFTLHSVDDVEFWQNLVRSDLDPSLKEHVQWHFAPTRMGTFSDRICTYYETLPNVCPDLIYLDGPSQGSVSGTIGGISTDHPDRLPMSADILRMEHFLLPGTLILVDGRTANARFLQANFQRNWLHRHDVEADVHTFELVEPPLGSVNRKHIEWALGTQWLDQFADSD